MAGQGYLDFTYDYAGRLLSAVNTQGFTDMTQSFTYDAAGNMRSNSTVGAYAYINPANVNWPAHAPRQVNGGYVNYDANGNMTSSPSLIPGFSDRLMGYDGENRPLSVSYQGDTTAYTYGADGSRLLRTEPSGDIVATFGPVEIRDFGGPNEEVNLAVVTIVQEQGSLGTQSLRKNGPYKMSLMPEAAYIGTARRLTIYLIALAA